MDDRKQRIIHRIIERLNQRINRLIYVRNRLKKLAESYDNEVDHETDPT